MSVGDASGRTDIDEALWLRSYTGPTTVGTFSDDTAAVYIGNPGRVSVQAQQADGATVATLGQLRAALRAGTLASTSFTVVVDARSRAVVALRQQR
jgi:TctA family transporter